MRRNISILVLVLVLVPAAAMAGRLGGKGGTGKMNVQVREVIVRTTPNYMAPQAGKLTYGAQVDVIGKDGNWSQIDAPSGWVPDTALSRHKVKVNPDQKFAGSGARHDEVALAGKGFNPQVEAQYKRNNPNLGAAFASVDRMEDYSATEAELKQFRTAGKLD